jgi:DNA-binding NtrC family response regulator
MAEALALFDYPGDIVALFTDIRLPEGDLAGFELAKKACERNPSLKVLYTTGQTITDGMKAMFVENGRLLPKPYTVRELTTAVKELFRSE